VRFYPDNSRALIPEQEVIPAQEVISGGAEHILIVDDKKDMVKMEEQRLNRSSYQVTSYLETKEDLDIFNKNTENNL